MNSRTEAQKLIHNLKQARRTHNPLRPPLCKCGMPEAYISLKYFSRLSNSNLVEVKVT